MSQVVTKMIDFEFPFHDRIRNLRQQYNMSQRDLADMLNMSDRGVQEWENPKGRYGKPVYPRLNQLIRLAEIFNMSINELLGVPVPEKDDIKSFNVFLRGNKWYYWEIRWGVGRILRGAFDTEAAARADLKERRGGRGMPERAHPENRNPYPGVNWHVHNRHWICQRYYHGQRFYLGTFFELEDAIAAVQKWESKYADAKHPDHVHTRRKPDHVGPRPGQRRPSNRDMGVGLQGDEGSVRREEEAVPGRRARILSRPLDRQEASSLSNIQKIMSRNKLPWKSK